MVDFKVKVGDKLKMLLVSKITGVPMGFLAGIWKFMDGKKTIFGLVVTALSAIAAVVPAVLAVFGIAAVKVAAVVGVFSTVIGALHRAYKFFYKEELP